MHCTDPTCQTCYTIECLRGVACRRGDKLVEDHPTMPVGSVLELARTYVADLGSSDEVRAGLAEHCAQHAMKQWLARSLGPRG